MFKFQVHTSSKVLWSIQISKFDTWYNNEKQYISQYNKKKDTWPNKNVTCGWTVWCHVSIHGGAMSASKVAPRHPPACHHMPRQLQAWPCHVELPLMTDLVINYDVNILSLKIIYSMTKAVSSLKSSLLWRICRFRHGGINVTAYAWRMSFCH